MGTISIDKHDDGSAWAAIVEVRGHRFSALFAGGCLMVRQVKSMDRRTAPAWALQHARKWAAAQVAALPAEWMALHHAA